MVKKKKGWLQKGYEFAKKSAKEKFEFERDLRAKQIKSQREERLKQISSFEQAKIRAKKEALLRQYKKDLNKPNQGGGGFMSGDVLGVRGNSSYFGGAPAKAKPAVKKRKTRKKVKKVRRKKKKPQRIVIYS